jgi:hypothetical protein
MPSPPSPPWMHLGSLGSLQTSVSEHDAGFLSRLTFGWLTPLLELGNKRELQMPDLWYRSAKAAWCRCVSLTSGRLQGTEHGHPGQTPCHPVPGSLAEGGRERKVACTQPTQPTLLAPWTPADLLLLLR